MSLGGGNPGAIPGPSCTVWGETGKFWPPWGWVCSVGAGCGDRGRRERGCFTRRVLDVAPPAGFTHLPASTQHVPACKGLREGAGRLWSPRPWPARWGAAPPPPPGTHGGARSTAPSSFMPRPGVLHRPRVPHSPAAPGVPHGPAGPARRGVSHGPSAAGVPARPRRPRSAVLGAARPRG